MSVSSRAAAPSSSVRPLAEGRPPGLTWRPVAVHQRALDQPTLDLQIGDPVAESPPRPSTTGVEVILVRARWCARQDRRLPDARTWGVSLAQALLETLHGLRPIAQLNRWLADEVLAEVAIRRRRDRGTGRRSAPPPPVLRSVRLQHPHPQVVEVSAHVAAAGRSSAIAFRLEARHDRWLCTALDLGPAPDGSAG